MSIDHEMITDDGSSAMSGSSHIVISIGDVVSIRANNKDGALFMGSV